MSSNPKLWAGLAGAGCMLVMIMDAKTSLLGARSGLNLCIYTVIPSLFPFFVISGIVNGALSGLSATAIRPIGRILRIPAGSEFILLLSVLGGYPIGSKNIQLAYQSGIISKESAERMIGFCNNAGPAFIFGIVGSMFGNPYIAWVIWIIHIISAILVGIILPGKAENISAHMKVKSVSISQILEQSLKSTALVCGWIIIFRVIIIFLERWFLWLLPETAQVVAIGLLELSNGCCELSRITNDGLRFVAASALLAAGGTCVAMQVHSVAQGLRISAYYQGKILHLSLTVILSAVVQGLLFANNMNLQHTLLLCFVSSLVILIILFVIKHKNDVAIRKKMLYNTINLC